MDVTQGQGLAAAPSNWEIAAFVDGTADASAKRRVLAAAVTDRSVRERIAALRAAESAAVTEEPLPEQSRLRLRHRMLAGALAVAEEPREAEEPLPSLAELPKAGGLWHVAAGAWEALLKTLASAARPLATGEHALQLPCLAPAAAAAGTSLATPRDSVSTPEGVRIEFQQLPGKHPRLRLIVDASGLTGATPATGFNAALVRLEDGREETANHHILVVALNAQGRGFTDFALGRLGMPSFPDDPRVLPAPSNVCRLAGATLAHLPELSDTPT